MWMPPPSCALRLNVIVQVDPSGNNDYCIWECGACLSSQQHYIQWSISWAISKPDISELTHSCNICQWVDNQTVAYHILCIQGGRNIHIDITCWWTIEDDHVEILFGVSELVRTLVLSSNRCPMINIQYWRQWQASPASSTQLSKPSGLLSLHMYVMVVLLSMKAWKSASLSTMWRETFITTHMPEQCW